MLKSILFIGLIYLTLPAQAFVEWDLGETGRIKGTSNYLFQQDPGVNSNDLYVLFIGTVEDSIGIFRIKISQELLKSKGFSTKDFMDFLKASESTSGALIFTATVTMESAEEGRVTYTLGNLGFEQQ